MGDVGSGIRDEEVLVGGLEGHANNFCGREEGKEGWIWLLAFSFSSVAAIAVGGGFHK